MAAVAPTLNITPSISGTVSGTGKLGSVQEAINQPSAQPFLQLLAGTGAGQADTVFEDIRTLGASASENLDLNGTLVDRFGNTVNLLHVKVIYIVADPNNTNDVVIGGAASNGAQVGFGASTHTWAISPGEVFLVTKGNAKNSQLGWPIVAATGDILKVLNGGAGTGVNYSIIVIGTST